MGCIVNFIGFQIGWAACVISVAQDQIIFAIFVTLSIVAFHLKRHNYPAEYYIILIATVTGFVWETLLLASGWLSYGQSDVAIKFAPIWLVAMWALFATTINSSLAWLKERWLLASLMGGVFGPLAFMAGEKLGAVQLNSSLALLALAIGWSIILPLLLWLADILKYRFESLEV